MALFDDIMTPEAQTRWLADLEWDDLEGERPDVLVDAAHYDRLTTFLRWPFAEEAEAFLEEYLLVTLPAVYRSEGQFWSLNVLQAPNLYARLHVGAQVAMQVYYDELEGTPLYDVFLPRALASAAIGAPVSRDGELYDITVDDEDEPFELLIGPSTLTKGGDQMVLTVTYAEDALDLTELALEQLRQHHLQLMRAGKTPAAAQHCWPLADRVLRRGG